MRELKFRAWDIDWHKFEYFEIGENDDSYGIFRVVANKFGTTVEQYIGLTDKTGKEIYEGDIVEQFVCGIHQFKGKKCGRSTIWQVRWDKKECCFELHYLSGSLFGDSMMSDGDEYEVIGNIHENPELLGGKE